MSKIDEIRGEMVKAMKAKDKARKDVLSLLLAELKNVEINNRTPLTDEEGNLQSRFTPYALEVDAGYAFPYSGRPTGHY